MPDNNTISKEISEIADRFDESLENMEWYQKTLKAKADVEKDSSLQKLIKDYLNKRSELIIAKTSADKYDLSKIEKLEEETNDLISEILSTPSMEIYFFSRSKYIQEIKVLNEMIEIVISRIIGKPALLFPPEQWDVLNAGVEKYSI